MKEVSTLWSIDATPVVSKHCPAVRKESIFCNIETKSIEHLLTVHILRNSGKKENYVTEKLSVNIYIEDVDILNYDSL